MNRKHLGNLRAFAWMLALGIPPVVHVMFAIGALGDGVVIVPLSGLTHTALYTGLLVAFGGSLRRGQEPIVARFARRVHGELPDDIAAYARTATVAWCVFCAGQLAASFVLFTMAPREAWSLFVNVLDLPLLAMMFITEYVWRRLRLPDRAHVGLVTTVSTFARANAVISRGG